MYTDFRWLRIPNVVTYPAMLVGLALSAFEGVPGAFFVNGPVDHIAAVVLAFALAYPFYVGGGLKAGDSGINLQAPADSGISLEDKSSSSEFELQLQGEEGKPPSKPKKPTTDKIPPAAQANAMPVGP